MAKKTTRKKVTRARKAATPQLSAPLQKMGASGLKHSYGIVLEEWIKQLSGRKGVRAFIEMRDNDAVSGALLHAREALVQQAPYQINAAGDQPIELLAKDLVESAFEDMETPWHRIKSEIMSMDPFGWANFELLYKYRRGQNDDATQNSKHYDGKVGWRDWVLLGQDSLDRWKIDDLGTTHGMYQRPAPTYRERFVPIEKSILFNTRSHKGNPEGRSIFRSAWRSFFFLKRIQEIEAIGIERDLAGLPKMEVPAHYLGSNATADEITQLDAFKELVEKIRWNEYAGLVIPSEQDREGKPTGFKFSLVNAGGRRPVDVNEIVKRYESRIAVSMLGEFVLLGMDNVGSFALADSKTHMFAVALGQTLRTIDDTINRKAIPELLKFNGIPLEAAPEYQTGDIEQPAMLEFSQAISTLVAAGVVLNDDALQTYVRERLSLPPAEEVSAMQLQDAIGQMRERDQQLAQPGSTQFDPRIEESIRRAIPIQNEVVVEPDAGQEIRNAA